MVRFRPLLVCSSYYGCLVPWSVWVHDAAWAAWSKSHHGAKDPPFAAGDTNWNDLRGLHFLAGYALWLLLWRLWVLRKSYVWYEYCWMCNFTLVASSWALATRRPYLALTYCTVVAVDQFLWYVDLLYYGCCWAIGRVRTHQSQVRYRRHHPDPPPPLLGRRRFLVGVCQYVFDDQVAWQSRVTCTHHLWTIPFVLWCLTDDPSLREHGRTEGLAAQWFLLVGLSGIFMAVHVCASRTLIPLYDDDTSTTNAAPKKYLNVNLGHAVWKDVKAPQLQVTHPSASVYLPRLLVRWQLLNAVFAFALLLALQALTSSPIDRQRKLAS